VRRPKVLCLHGSRQDGQIFQQRIAKLVKRLQCIAELYFVESPHTLPLDEGKQVAMRAWWRWDAREEASEDSSTPTAVYSVAKDWEASVAVLKNAWRRDGPFVGVLGFSNGAAASQSPDSH